MDREEADKHGYPFVAVSRWNKVNFTEWGCGTVIDPYDSTYSKGHYNDEWSMDMFKVINEKGKAMKKTPEKHFMIVDHQRDVLGAGDRKYVTEKEAVEDAKKLINDEPEGTSYYIVKTAAKVTKGKTPIRTTKIK